MEKATAIICVYNEQDTIENVIISTSKEQFINEIVVVNDGSTDSSKSIINKLKSTYNLNVINFEINKGKGYAMAVGVENAKHDIVMFIDADQTRITPNYTSELIMSLINKECDMVLGYSTVNILKKDINPLKILTGERALFKKDIMPILDKIKASRFGVETLLYFYYISVEKSIKFIRLSGLKHRDKYKKASFKQATNNYIGEGWEIIRTAFKNYDMVLKPIQNQITKYIAKNKKLIIYQIKN